MKRLNPDTGKPFTCGTVRDIDPKGKGRTIFCNYSSKIDKAGFCYENWETPAKFFKRQSKRKAVSKGHPTKPIGRAKRMMINSRNSAKKRKIVFELKLEDILPAIERGTCELTGVKFDLNPHPEKNHNPYGPSIDRIDSRKGYTKDNIRIVLWFVNCAVGEGSDEEALPLLKAMIEAIEKNVRQKSASPVPAGHYPKSEEHTKHGVISTTRLGEDDDHPHHHCGTIQWEDLNNRPETSSGDGVAHRNKKVETSPALTRIEDNGNAEPEIVRLDFGSGRLFD